MTNISNWVLSNWYNGLNPITGRHTNIARNNRTSEIKPPKFGCEPGVIGQLNRGVNRPFPKKNLEFQGAYPASWGPARFTPIPTPL
jgi:hypothetical protein